MSGLWKKTKKLGRTMNGGGGLGNGKSMFGQPLGKEGGGMMKRIQKSKCQMISKTVKTYIDEKLWEKQEEKSTASSSASSWTRPAASSWETQASSSWQMPELPSNVFDQLNKAAESWNKFTEDFQAMKKRNDLEKRKPAKQKEKDRMAAKKIKTKPTLQKVPEESSSDESSSAEYPMVCVDWRNTLAHKGKVCTENLNALKDIWNANFDICILSWCYKNRAKEVQAACEKLEGPWERQGCRTTEHRTGEGGKADLCKDWNIKYIFDDASDICEECHKQKLEVYPIRTKWENHPWALDKGVPTYKSFADAVKEFLKKQSQMICQGSFL